MDILWIALAYSAGLLVSLLALPTLVGYLLVGFVLSGFGFSAGALLHELAHWGVLLLLFTVGLKLRLRNLLQPEVWAGGLVHFALLTSFFTLLLILLSMVWQIAAFLAAGLAFSSTVLAAKVLEQKHELKAFHGRVAMGILIVQDLIAVGLMAFVGPGEISPWALLLLLLLFVRPLLNRLFSMSGHAELLLLYGVLLALGGGSLFEFLGLGSELGAIIMGVLLADHARSQDLADKLWGLKEVFLVAFFVEVGLTGLPDLATLGMSLGLLLLVFLKGVIFFGLFIRFKLRARNAFLAALALMSYSEFALITAQVGVEAGLISSSLLTMLALTVALSFALAAPLNHVAHGLYERYEKHLIRFESKERHPDQQPLSLGSARTLVVGMGRTGSTVYRLLREANEAIVGLDSDPGMLERHRSQGLRVLYGDAEDPELWSSLNLDKLEIIYLTMPDFEAKFRASKSARKRGYRGVIAATSHFADEDKALREAGVDFVFNPFAEAGARLARLGLELVATGETRV